MYWGFKTDYLNNKHTAAMLTFSLALCIPNISAAAQEPKPSASTAKIKVSIQAVNPGAATSIAPSVTSSQNQAPSAGTSPTPSQTAGPSPSSSASTPSTPSTPAVTPPAPNSNAASGMAGSTSPNTNSSSTSSPTTTSTAASPNPTQSPATPTPTASPENPKTELQVTVAEKKKAIMDFLKQAVDYIKDNGKETSIAEFNKKDGIFTKDSLYVFAISYDGIVLATQSFNQSLLGTNQLTYKDPDGFLVVQGLIEKAKSGGGWVLFKFENPVTKAVECKNAYVLPAIGTGDYLIGTGYYYPASAKGKCEVEK